MGQVTALLGGARSGKSALALRLAGGAASPVTFIATAEALDDDMAERIHRHRHERPPEWTTIEAPRQLISAVSSVPDGNTIIVDCLTLWAANTLDDAEHLVIAELDRLLVAFTARAGATILVTNEVGLGVHPEYESGRTFRDRLGRINTLLVERSTQAFFVIAGRVVPLIEMEITP